MSGISLYQIEDALQQLVGLREQAESEGDLEALKVIDQQLRDYLTKEAAKVTNYVRLIKQQEDLDAACAREMGRIRDIRERAIALRRKLEANALAVMQQFGVRELKATPGGGLRIQGNGGVQPLEVDVALVPIEMSRVTVTMPAVSWEAIEDEVRRDAAGTVKSSFYEPDTERIREALAQRVPCPECKGMPYAFSTPDGKCPQCASVGTIPNTVPGAKLLERGEHLRVI